MRPRRPVLTCLSATVALLLAVLVSSPAANAATRALDSAPFWGGDRVWSWTSYPYWVSCTGGFEMADLSHAYGTTAGHCPLADDHPPGIGAGYFTGDPTTNVYWGQIQRATRTTVDAAVAPVAGAQAVVWSNTGGRSVRNWETVAQDAVGLHVCVDGAAAHEVCGATNTAVNVGAQHLVRSRCPGTTHCSVPGDSGGPVYAVYANGDVEAVGLIVNQIEATTASGAHLYWSAEWEPIRFVMSWMWTFNRHMNLLCDTCSPEP